MRPREDLDEALAHELADCLWSVMILADAYEVDLEGAFDSTMAELSDHAGLGGRVGRSQDAGPLC